MRKIFTGKPGTPQFILYFFWLLVFLFMALTWTSDVTVKIRRKERINILILGTDRVDYTRHADIVLLTSYSSAQRYLDIISIPRDTLVRQGSKSLKLGEVYAREWGRTHDEALAASAVGDMVAALTGIKPHSYIDVDYTAFRDIVDALGGVRIKVAEDMDYDDNAGNLHIHIKKGEQVLNGQRALEFVRFRGGPRGDLDRIESQHMFLRQLVEQSKSFRFVFSLGKITKTLKRNVTTDLTFWDILALVLETPEIDGRHFRVQSLPGNAIYSGTRSYFEPGSKQIEDLRGAVLGTDRAGFRNIMPARHVRASKSEENGECIEVEVWNATDRPGLAQATQKYLREKGIDVVRWGNWGENEKFTHVIARTDDFDKAFYVGQLIKCNNLKSQIDRERIVDVSVVLGDDFK